LIRLLEHEDDIYLNSYIDTVRLHTDADSFFDDHAYDLIHRLIVPEIESRLADLLIGLDKRASRQANMAETLFRQGYEYERGLFCDQDFTLASGRYVKAAAFGIVEARYRLGWLVENELVQGGDLPGCDEYYRQAAEAGNIKAVVATGQRLLFNASDRNDIQKSLACFTEAERADWPCSIYYLTVLNDLLLSTDQIAHEQVASELAHYLPTPGNQPNDSAMIYHETSESDIRLARYCHQHNVEAGSFFLSWCHLTGLCLPKDRNRAREFAMQFANTESPDLLYYIAWVFLRERTALGSARVIQYIRRAADRGLSAAQKDLAALREMNLLSPVILLRYLKETHRRFEIEKWFQSSRRF
jgi:TPR repeat protein